MSTPNVLVLDDEPDTTFTFETGLEASGFRVDSLMTRLLLYLISGREYIILYLLILRCLR